MASEVNMKVDSDIMMMPDATMARDSDITIASDVTTVPNVNIAANATSSDPDIDPRFIFKKDFEELCLHDPKLERMRAANQYRIDFHRLDHVQQVTKALLKVDFKLRIDLPDNRLCPPVLQRYEYVRWIQDMLDSTDPSLSGKYDPSRVVKGLDIGVGASNIYSLLSMRSRPAWRMYGTDIDDESFAYAENNLASNALSTRMRLVKMKAADPLIPLDKLGTLRLDFVMCNPPFFGSNAEADASLAGAYKSGKAHSACAGSRNEMVTEGGDLGFVDRIVEESLKLRTKVQWYSSMFGRHESMVKIAAKLKELGITNTAIAILRAEGRTSRFCIAWSFHGFRPSNDVARRHILPFDHIPFPTCFEFKTADGAVDLVTSQIDELMQDIDVNWTWNENKSVGTGFSRGIVWSRHARRHRKRREAAGEPPGQQIPSTPDAAIFAFRLEVTWNQVIVHWLKGDNQVVFESMCALVHRKIGKEN